MRDGTMHYKLEKARTKTKYEERIVLLRTVSGFIILGTGLTVLLKGIWMTEPVGNFTWAVTLCVGMLLVIIAALAISYKG